MKPAHIAALPLAFALLAASQSASQAFVTPLVLLDAWVKKEAKVALATPGHAEWCAKNHPGYRKQWNNYRVAGGRVAYCASPYYTPPWQVPYANRGAGQ